MVQQVTMLHSKALGFWSLGSATRLKFWPILQVWNVYGHLLNQCVCKRQNTTSSIVLRGLATSDGVIFDTLCFFFVEFPSKCFRVWYSSEYRGCLPVAPVQSWHRSTTLFYSWCKAQLIWAKNFLCLTLATIDSISIIPTFWIHG
jgi:hypothetical protein